MECGALPLRTLPILCFTHDVSSQRGSKGATEFIVVEHCVRE